MPIAPSNGPPLFPSFRPRREPFRTIVEQTVRSSQLGPNDATPTQYDHEDAWQRPRAVQTDAENVDSPVRMLDSPGEIATTNVGDRARHPEMTPRTSGLSIVRDIMNMDPEIRQQMISNLQRHIREQVDAENRLSRIPNSGVIFRQFRNPYHNTFEGRDMERWLEERAARGDENSTGPSKNLTKYDDLNGMVLPADVLEKMLCPISLEPYTELSAPILVKAHETWTLFEYEDFKQHWESFGTNPLNRQRVNDEDIYRAENPSKDRSTAQ